MTVACNSLELSLITAYTVLPPLITFGAGFFIGYYFGGKKE